MAEQLTNEAETAHAKYVFLDIVKFSVNRTVEAQSDIIAALNSIVKEAIAVVLENKETILLPTGDGLCIAIISPTAAYDSHLRCALRILELVDTHNSNITDEQRKFALRIGLNENVDNIVTDINNNKNIAGAGINTAQRIMNCASPSQVMVGTSVYEMLRHREKYQNKFREYTINTKHNERLDVFQYTDEFSSGLNIEHPEFALNRPAEPENPLSRYQAYYIHFATVYRKEIAALEQHEQYCPAIILHFMAEDAVNMEKATDIDKPSRRLHGDGDMTFAELLAYYQKTDFWVAADFREIILNRFDGIRTLFEKHVPIFFKKQALDRLEKDHNDISALTHQKLIAAKKPLLLASSK